MSSIEELVEYFAKLPSIGPRQARRFVYFLLRQDKHFLETFSDRIRALGERVATCSSCCRFFAKRRSEKECPICASPRNEKQLMVVEKDVDLDNIERLGGYDGYYFVLDGTVPLSNSIEHTLRTNELLDIVKKRVKEGLSEIILAMSASPDGEHTAAEIRALLEPLAKKHNLAITALGRGLSTGLELEYSDAETIKNALHNRA